jgi:two-component system, chemotaxis family, sensor kinase CheA
MDPMDFDRDELLAIFSAETEENLRQMEEAFVQLESAPDDVETLQAIFRAAHTIKGNAAGLGFPALAKFAHALEDVLDRIRSGALALNTALATVLLEAVDGLREIATAAIAGHDGLRRDHLDLIERLEATAESADDGPAVLAAVPGQDDRRASIGRRWVDLETAFSRSQTLRVDIDKLDRMLNLTGEIAVARERLGDLLDGCARGPQIEAVVEAHRAADRLFLDLQEEVMKIRMVPLGPTFRQFFRTVRDVATAGRKHVQLELQGEDVDVDTNVIEHLRDPLTHLVRNAVDHGIESPEVRHATGKDATGRVRLQARHEGGSIVIQVQDDGGGLDRARIIARARAHGDHRDLESMPDGELFRLILEPGFSTAERVTEYSGRGVGMDVVRRNVERLRGSIGVDGKPGAGTTITLRLPLTLAIIRGFSVGVGDDTYVVPLDSVVECLEFPPAAGRAGRGVLSLRGRPLPYLRLRDHFRCAGEAPERENVLVLRHYDQQVCLVVDRLLGESQTVIKPLGRVLGEVPGLSGSAILGSGRVALILEVDTLLREALKDGLAA